MKTKKLIAIIICALSVILTVCVGCEKGQVTYYVAPKAIACGIEAIPYGGCRYFKCDADKITKPIVKGELIGYVVNSNEIDEFEKENPDISYLADTTNTTYNPCNDNKVPIYIIEGYIDNRYMFLELDEGSQRIFFKRGMWTSVALGVNLSDKILYNGIEYIKTHDFLNPYHIGDEKLGYLVSTNYYEDFIKYYPDEVCVATYVATEWAVDTYCFPLCSVEGYDTEQYVCVYIWRAEYYVYKNPAYQANQQ